MNKTRSRKKTIFNMTRKMLMLARSSIPAHPTITHDGHRVFYTEAVKNLRKIFDGKSNKERKADEACEKALEAADSLKESAMEVKETWEFVRDTAETTSKAVTNASRQVQVKVTETTNTAKEKIIKEPVKELLNNAMSATTKKIEDKMVEKIRGRVLGKAAQDEVKDILEKTKKS